MKHAEKSRIILELLGKRGKLSAAEAAEKLHLSAPTIRREFKRKQYKNRQKLKSSSKHVKNHHDF